MARVAAPLGLSFRLAISRAPRPACKVAVWSHYGGRDKLNFVRVVADEGATFGEVVDRLRRSLALQYLKEPGFSLCQIAWLVGYEGSTSFTHAFRRWTGRSPSVARNEIRLSAPA